MKNLLISLTVLAGLSACGAAVNQVNPVTNLRFQSLLVVEGYSRTVNSFLTAASQEQAIEKSKEVVASSLKDPGSAQFRNVRMVPYMDGQVVCGDVNGKNSYGGYVGFVPFVASTDASYLYDRDTKYPAIQSAANAGLTAACRG